MLDNLWRANPQALADYILAGLTKNPAHLQAGSLEERYKRLNAEWGELAARLDEPLSRELCRVGGIASSLHFELGMKAGILLAQGLELGGPPPGE